MDRRRRTGVLLLLCWTLIGLCCAGHRPRERGERTRHTRHHERWSQGIRDPSLHGRGAQRIEYPSLNDEGTQRVRYPWVQDRGQTVHYPSVNDSGKCAPGYFRDRSGLLLGRCVPCECNGLADECEERTGKCLSCQFNTAGDRCERCKDGYYGNAAQKACRVCPCPFSLFAIGCKEVFGDFECKCRAGYRGDKCESCASGYYGDPLIPGGSCRPCNCYGNGNNCDPRTGGKIVKSFQIPTVVVVVEKVKHPCRLVRNMSIDLLFFYLVLDHVKANLTKQCDKNQAAAEKLRGLLKGYEAKLKDLDKALKEAVDLVKKANAQNGLNAQTLGDLQVEKKVELVDLFNEQSEYEQLAAQMDGAKTDLTKKVNEIANAAAKKGIVEAAEEHARNLDKLARDLENAVKNTSGRPEVRNAKDAIDAYKNITDAVNAAEAAANEAKGAADNALNNLNKQKLTQRATDLKETSDDLLKNAKDAEKDLQGIHQQLITNSCVSVKEVEQVKALWRGLLPGFIFILITHFFKSDEVRDMIDDAKNQAASANNTATNTMNKLNDIKKEIDKINLSPVNSNLGKVLDDVDKSVKNLLKTIPSLNDKLSEVENLTSQFSTLSNISENIKKMKELIEQARDAANRIVVPMSFLGDGHVEMRAPKNLEDLKAYTSLSLSLQRPEDRGDGRRRRRQAGDKGDMFVLYLGNRDVSDSNANVLYGVYKLNGVEYSIQSGSISKSPSEPAQFDQVDFQRIYQDVQMNLTKDITSNTPTEPIVKNNKGEESKNLLDISPSDVVFYVGGYPDNFTLPASLSYPKYKGCIEFFSLNNKVVSLYNFQKAENINVKVPCKRFYCVPLHRYNITTLPFKGCLKNMKLNKNFKWCPSFLILARPHFSLDVRTRALEGLLFFAATRGGRSHLVLYISKGRIRLSVGKQKEIFNREKYNDGKWHSVIFSLEKKTFRLVVDGIRAQDGLLTNAELTSMQQFVSPVYLGSLKALPKQSVSGCIRNFKMNGAPMSNPTTNHGAGPCFEGQTQRGAYFSGNGAHVILNDSFIVGSSFELLFNIRPRSPTGLLLHVGDSSWNQYGFQVKCTKSLHSRQTGTSLSMCLLVIKRKNVVQLHVDTMDHYKIGPPSSTVSLTKDSLYVGGIPGENEFALPVTSSFVGCIQDMRINGDSVSFDRPSGVFGPVNLKECPG
uniref:Si:ch211-241e1.3 n=1 Tax=Cyclopterus lumpus TaxID=8103 RepID=A0A8C2YYV5_CYCLU